MTFKDDNKSKWNMYDNDNDVHRDTSKGYSRVDFGIVNLHYI